MLGVEEDSLIEAISRHLSISELNQVLENILEFAEDACEDSDYDELHIALSIVYKKHPNFVREQLKSGISFINHIAEKRLLVIIDWLIKIQQEKHFLSDIEIALLEKIQAQASKNNSDSQLPEVASSSLCSIQPKVLKPTATTTGSSAENPTSERKLKTIPNKVLREGIDFYKKPDSFPSGSFGNINLVQDLKDKQLVILKTAKVEADSSMIEVEAQMLSRLDHFNIVKFIHIQRLNKQLQLFIEYCCQGDLYDYMRNNDKKPSYPNNVYKFAFEQLSALEYLEQMGVVHRDIKPENIFIGGTVAEPSSKLGDFGLAAQSKVAKTDTFLGSCPYASPEVYMAYMEGKKYPYSAASDLYSAMATFLVVILLKHNPFSKDINAKIKGVLLANWCQEMRKRKLAVDSNTAISFVYIDNIPETLIHVIHQGMKWQPEDRPSAASLKEQLAPPSATSLDAIAVEVSADAHVALTFAKVERVGHSDKLKQGHYDSQQAPSSIFP